MSGMNGMSQLGVSNTATPDQQAQLPLQQLGNKPKNMTRMDLMKALKKTQSLPTDSGYTP
jgi:hypothetical protein